MPVAAHILDAAALPAEKWIDMRALVLCALAAAGCYDLSGISDHFGITADLGAPDLAEPDLGPLPVPVRFNEAPSYFVENNPVALELVDFDGDHKKDLVTANSLAGSVTVLLRRAGGHFAAQPSSPSGGAEPVCLGVGDFDGAGLQDIAVGNYTGQSVVLLVGDGRGGVARSQVIAQGFRPVWIRVADFDGDQRPDLLVGAERSAEPVRLLRNDGHGAFSMISAVSPDSSSPSTRDATVADWNGDGVLDYAVTVKGEMLVGVGVALGHGDGTFSLSNWTLGGRAWPVEVAANDVDGDGRQDLLIFDDKALRVERGLGDGTFRALTSEPVGYRQYGIVTGDFDGDGHADVAYQGDQTVKVGLGRGDGTWKQRAFAGVNWAQDLIAGDVDGDGRIDLVSFSDSNSRVAVLRGDGSGQFFAPDAYPTGAGAGIVRTADLDGTGGLDLAFVGNDGFCAAFNDGGGRFVVSKVVLPGASPAGALAVANFDGIGPDDLAVSDPQRNQVVFHRGMGKGTFGPATPCPAGAGPLALASGDFDGDGPRDLVVVNPEHDEVTVLRGDPAGFSPPVAHPVGKWPVAVATADLNGDRRDDILVVHRDGNSMGVLLALGAARFAPRVDYPVGRLPRALATGHFDDDGVLDVAVADGRDHDVALFKGRGDGSFTPAGRSPAGPTPLYLESADVNGDQRPDLVAVGEGGEVHVLLGRSLLRFAPPQQVAAIPHGDNLPNGMAVGDFDGDARPDLTVTVKARFAVLRNLTGK